MRKYEKSAPPLFCYVTHYSPYLKLSARYSKIILTLAERSLR